MSIYKHSGSASLHVWIIRKLNNQTSILSRFILKNEMFYTIGIYI